jgi:NADPH2:quinone reductase
VTGIGAASYRALVCRQLGPPGVLERRRLRARRLASGDVRVAITAAGVNLVDALQIAGRHQGKPALPFVPGLESCGTVIEVGDGVDTPTVGSRVIAQHSRRLGGYAQQAVLPASSLVAAPSALDDFEAATFLVAYRTAWHALVQRGAIAAGEVVLVHGASGGMGAAAIDVARSRGATVVAVASTAKKRAFALDCGAHYAIEPDGFVERVKELTDGHGVDLVFDPVGGDAFDGSLRCVAWCGRILVIGFASGRIADAPTNRILLKGCSVIGIAVGDAGRRDPSAESAMVADLLAAAEAGALRPRVTEVHSLGSAPQALEALVQRRAMGRVVIDTTAVDDQDDWPAEDADQWP